MMQIGAALAWPAVESRSLVAPRAYSPRRLPAITVSRKTANNQGWNRCGIFKG
jgi:hypothetical protein